MNHSSSWSGFRAVTFSLALVAFASFSAFGQAPSGTANSASDGDWSNNTTWGAIKAPSSVAVNIYHNVTLSSDIIAARNAAVYTGNLVIGDASNANGDGSLTITSAGNLAFIGTTTIARNVAGSNGGNGALTLDGGIFGGAAINLGSGSTGVSSATGVLTVKNGATLNTSGTLVVGGSGANQQYGSFTNIGSTNEITLSGLNLRNGLLSFTADLNGISTINVSGNTLFNDPNSRLAVDGAAYAGGSTEWSLIDGTNNLGLTNFGFDTLASRTTITGFDSSRYLTALIYDSANYDLKLQITAVSAIPEPSTYAALAGGLALGVTMLRRRRARR
ncbi:MAG TPA: PEP-CTERM sorting domain-containing protein [Opitutaceae bacterium]